MVMVKEIEMGLRCQNCSKAVTEEACIEEGNKLFCDNECYQSYMADYADSIVGESGKSFFVIGKLDTNI